jgi:hypothetical protein
MAKTILVVLTGTAKYPDLDRATGVWFGEAGPFLREGRAGKFRGRLRRPAGRPHADQSAQPCHAEPTDW